MSPVFETTFLQSRNPQPFSYQRRVSWRTIFAWTEVGGIVSGQIKHITFTVHFISTTITSSPPQIIRHQRREVGDSCQSICQICRGSQEAKSEKVKELVTQLCQSLPASLSMEFSSQEYQSRLPFSSPGNLPDPGTEPEAPELQADSLPSGPPGKPQKAKYPSIGFDSLSDLREQK